MKRKKGLTLVELIAVVVILSLVVGFSVAIFINVRNNILEKDYQNLKSYIETKAIEYFEQTGITTINVEEMIKLGLIKPDDETDIYDPRDKEKSLNCFVVEATVNENGSFEVKSFKEIKDGNTCGNYQKKGAYIVKYYDNLKNEWLEISRANDTWIKPDNDGKVLLKAEKLNGELDDSYNISWTTPHGNTSNKVTYELTNLKNTTTTSAVTLSVSPKEETKDYYDNSSEVTYLIKTDDEAPNIKISDINFDSNWTNKLTKEVIFKYNDSGSGVFKYGVKDNKITTCNNIDLDEIQDGEKNKLVKSLKEGEYSLCLVDKLGNTTEPIYFNVDKFDGIAPEIDLKDANIITKNNVKTLAIVIKSDYKFLNYIKATDTLSGVKEVKAFVDNKILDSAKNLTAGGHTLEYRAIDNAGNKTIIQIKLTIVIPKIEITEIGETEYEILVDGNYSLQAWGAQGGMNGSYSGGKGGYTKGEIYLHKGDILTILVGSQAGTFNGGTKSGTANGGDSSIITIKTSPYNSLLNGTKLLVAAGGGGAGTGSNGGAGGSGNASGGASVGNGAGAIGKNGGGGSSSPSYTYQSCSTCGGACTQYKDCCGSYSCFFGVCQKWDESKKEYVGVGTSNCSNWCSATEDDCISRAPTYSCNCSWNTNNGKPGSGGSNSVSNKCSNTQSKENNNSGNGKATIEWIEQS